MNGFHGNPEYESKQSNLINRDYTEDDLDHFQLGGSEKILRMWKKMREGGNSKDGKVTKEKYKSIFQFIFKNVKESIMDAVFERFKRPEDQIEKKLNDKKLENTNQDKKEIIDLHDLVVALTIISRNTQEEKMKLLLKITDIDEDDCLSTSDIFKLILAIERNFARESCYLDPVSPIALSDIATRKAIARFRGTFPESANFVNNGEKGKSAEKLKDFDDVIKSLNDKKDWFGDLLPRDVRLSKILANGTNPEMLNVNAQLEGESNIEKFVNSLHETIWTKATQEYTTVNNKKINQVYKEPPYHVPFQIARKNPFENTNLNKKEDKKEDGRNRDDEETVVNEKTINEHKERVKKMKQQSQDPHLKNTLGIAATINNNKKEGAFSKKGTSEEEARDTVIPQLPEFRDFIKMRVERVSKDMKNPYKNYEEYLYKKLTKHAEPQPGQGMKSKKSAPVLLQGKK